MDLIPMQPALISHKLYYLQRELFTDALIGAHWGAQQFGALLQTR